MATRRDHVFDDGAMEVGRSGDDHCGDVRPRLKHHLVIGEVRRGGRALFGQRQPAFQPIADRGYIHLRNLLQFRQDGPTVASHTHHGHVRRGRLRQPRQQVGQVRHQGHAGQCSNGSCDERASIVWWFHHGRSLSEKCQALDQEPPARLPTRHIHGPMVLSQRRGRGWWHRWASSFWGR